MSIKDELTSGKILVVSGDGKHGVISELTSKYRVGDLLDELKAELEDDMKAKMSENIVHYEFGMNIEFFTQNRWLVSVKEEDGYTTVRMGFPNAGVVINDSSSVYVPPFLIVLTFQVDGKGELQRTQCYSFVYVPGIPLDEYFKKAQKYSQQKIHPHVYGDGKVCTGSGLSKFPKEFQLDGIVTWIDAFVKDFHTYNPSSPVTRIDQCNLGQDLLKMRIDGKSDKEIIDHVFKKRSAND